VQLKVHYFHSRQKAEQIRLVGKMLRNIFAAKIAPTADATQLLQEADSIDFDQCQSLIADLQRPQLVPASPAAVAVAPADDAEEGAVEEEGEVADAAAVAPPRLIAQPHSATVSAGLAAWRLLECPPIPAPDAEATHVPTAPLQPYTTDEFVREAVEAFRAQWKAELAAGSVPRPEEDKPAARKRRRSASRSRSASRTAAKKATATSASSSTRAPASSSKAARSPSRSSRSPKRQRDGEGATKKSNGTSAAAADVTTTAATAAAPAAAAAMEDDEPEEGEL
jgi:hypothetical protein